MVINFSWTSVVEPRALRYYRKVYQPAAGTLEKARARLDCHPVAWVVPVVAVELVVDVAVVAAVVEVVVEAAVESVGSSY